MLRRHRLPLFVLGWYITFVLPASRLMPLGHSLVGDRYTYLPAIGLSVGIGMMLQSLKGIKWKRIGLVSLFATVFLLGTLTWKQCKVWRDDLSLWQHTVAVVPDSAVANGQLGSAYCRAGRLEEAKGQFRILQQLAPHLPGADFGFATVYGQEGNFEKAVDHLERVIRMEPHHKDAYVYLGIAYCGLEDWENAHRAFQKARDLGGGVPKQFLRRVLQHVNEG